MMAPSTVKPPSAPQAKSRTIPGFGAIGDGIYLHTPPSSRQSPVSGSEPALIILCPWMGATTGAIHKYTTLYTTLFPTSTLLVVTTTIPDLLYRRFSTIHARLEPARTVIDNLTSTTNSSGKVLLHIFSNGGSNIGIQLALSTPSLSPNLSGVIIDCAPAHARFTNIYTAAVTTLLPSSTIPALLARLAFLPAIGAVTTVQNSGIVVSSNYLRNKLNDPEVFGSVRRLYLYSADDAVVPVGDVQEHVAEARGKGLIVDDVRFEGVGHCGILIGREREYRDIIQRWPRGESVGAEGEEGIGRDGTEGRLRSKL